MAAKPQLVADNTPPPPLFAVDLDVEIPAAASTTQRSNSLPFKGKFDEIEEFAVKARNPHFFVPLSFFKERAREPEKVDCAYARSKVRDQFNGWKKDKEVQRNKLGLTTIDRAAGDPNPKGGTFAEPGVSVWMTTA